MKRSCLFFTILATACVLNTYSIYAQVKGTTPQVFTVKEIVQWDFHSRVVGDDFRIYVHFPPGYDTAKTQYPVLYMTDGDWNMTVAMNCFNMLRQDYDMVEPLIIGIGYGDGPNKRGRDLSPAEGGPKFLAFIKDEVMPFVESKYRVNDNKALYGYSLGGMFSTYVLFNHPQLFDMVFIGAPGNEGNDLIPTAKKYFATHKELTGKVFAGVGSYEAANWQNIQKFKAYLLKQKLSNFEIQTAVTPNANHGAALAQVMQNAIAFAYCKKHKPIQLTYTQLQQYAGNYSYAAAKDQKYRLFVSNGKLFFKQNDNLPIEFTPYATDSFFMYDNERADLKFSREGGKMHLDFIFPNEKPTRLERIN